MRSLRVHIHRVPVHLCSGIKGISVDEQTLRDGVQLQPRCSVLIARFVAPFYLGRSKERFYVSLRHLRSFSTSCLGKHSVLAMNDLFCKLVAVKTKGGLGLVQRINCSSIVTIVAEIVETTIFLFAREIENKLYKRQILWICEC